MAGDTHDFEYYKEIGGGDSKNVMHHFVNGGGGAYLSIGTALDFPEPAAVTDWAFYPRTDPTASQARRRDATMETTVLAMDQMVQGLAGQRRGTVGPVRF